jgi:hypothetical protein
MILLRALRAAGYTVEPFEPRFNQHTLDVEWFPLVAAQGWLALSRNRRQRYVTDERDVAMRSGLALFHLIRCGSHSDLAPTLVSLVPKILAFRERHDPPFIARVSRTGRVVMDLTLAEWQRSQRRGEVGARHAR